MAKGHMYAIRRLVSKSKKTKIHSDWERKNWEMWAGWFASSWEDILQHFTPSQRQVRGQGLNCTPSAANTVCSKKILSFNTGRRFKVPGKTNICFLLLAQVWFLFLFNKNLRTKYIIAFFLIFWIYFSHFFSLICKNIQVEFIFLKIKCNKIFAV